ncbi:MAG: dihydroorotase [Deltaproteobacteria bacterium]|nr:dihydroorotase [Deltaproteobacteria bacterium]
MSAVFTPGTGPQTGRTWLVSGRVIDSKSGLDAVRSVLIEDGKIKLVREAPPDAGERENARVIDCANLLILPGFVDLHVHLREPGEEGKETIETGVRSAVAGGVTTLVAMPNTKPVMDSAAIVRLVQSRGREAGLAKVLCSGAITRGSLGEALSDAAELRDAGVVVLTDDGRPVMHAGVMRRALEYATDLKLPVMIHAEDLHLSSGGAMNEGPVSTRLGLPGVPAAAEVAMVQRDILLAELTGAHLHVAHVSAAGSVRAIRDAKARGLKITAEATPHHFTLTDEAVAGVPSGYPNAPAGIPYDTFAKMSPPLRGESDRQAIVGALADGVIDAIATDHAPHGPLDKQVEFGCAMNGITGLETSLALTLSLVRTGELSLLAAVDRLTYGPARALHLPGGTLSVGVAADVTVVDPERVWKVDSKLLHSKSKNSPFLGWSLKGKVLRTFVDGREVYRLEDR